MLDFIINTIRLIKLVLRCCFYGIPISYAMLRSAKTLNKSFEIIEKNERRLGKKLLAFIQNSGPSFIKLGQILSTRSDLTGDIISEELSKLRDKLPSFSFEEAREIIELELGRHIDDLFLYIEPKPVAAASIAQVHKAVTLNNDEIAVKILRPDIERMFERDLKLFKFVIRVFTFFSKDTSRLRLKEIVKTLSEIVRNELNLRYEAACADKLRENCKNDSGVVIPRVYWELTSQKVLTTEWVEGISITKKNELIKAGHDLQEISKKLAITFFNQAYRDGFFHADLHPGNIFVNTSGDIVLVDFGIMGSMQDKDRIFIAKVIYAFIQKDYKTVSDLHFEAGIVPSHIDREMFALACRSIGEPIVGQPVNKISIGKLLKQLMDLSRNFEMITQTQFLLLQKTILTIEGVGMEIYPEVNMWKLAEPWIKNWAQENFGLKYRVKKALEDIKMFLENFPSLLSKINELIEELTKKSNQK
jgi:ubiquinone biosynthesis protein